MSALPWILGISSSHNGAACLLHGSEIAVAIQEERLLRQKRAEHPGAAASLSVQYCFDYAGISANDLSSVVLCAAASAKKSCEDVYLNSQLQVHRYGTHVLTIPHHLGHAYAVYGLSGMSSAGVLVVDGNGSPWDELTPQEKDVIVPGQLAATMTSGRTVPRENISLYRARDGVIIPLEKHVASYPTLNASTAGLQQFQTLGDMYGFVGRQIFGSFFEGPGKVMGLAPYGKATIPTGEFYDISDEGIAFRSEVLDRFRHNDRWPARQTEYQNLAASVQGAIEEAVLHLCRRLKQFGEEQLCYAGGVALNSVANERIVRESGLRPVFIMPAAEDSGTAVGAAFYGLWQLCGFAPRASQVRDSVGRSYKEEDITIAVQRTPGVVANRQAKIVETAVELLLDGKIVGWFQAGSELGPRSLGQRSILCDARRPEMKDVLNSRVKFREGFRPFAPIIRIEDVHDWFDVERELGYSPFMLRVLPFRPSRATEVPAVVHVDGTGRVQTATKEASPKLHQLLTLFKEATGVPLLLNTSLNIAGEPIVETPSDALWCLAFTDMDCCIVDEWLVSKKIREQGVDPVFDVPLTIGAHRIALVGERRDDVLFGLTDSDEISERVYSVHSSRWADLEEYSNRNPWVRLRLSVYSRWGEVLHGLPAGFAKILELVNGKRTGRQIYIEVVASSSNTAVYTQAMFRRHLGLLRRIGAIRFLALQESIPIPADEIVAAKSIGL